MATPSKSSRALRTLQESVAACGTEVGRHARPAKIMFAPRPAVEMTEAEWRQIGKSTLFLMNDDSFMYTGESHVVKMQKASAEAAEPALHVRLIPLGKESGSWMLVSDAPDRDPDRGPGVQ